jgi:transcriptional regulator with XRE-family HTH domain
MKPRAELYKSTYFWLEKIQNDIYRNVVNYMEERDINQSQLAIHLGVSRGYVSQILNGNYNFSLKKLIDLSLKIEAAPEINFAPIQDFIRKEDQRLNAMNGKVTTNFVISKTTTVQSGVDLPLEDGSMELEAA